MIRLKLLFFMATLTACTPLKSPFATEPADATTATAATAAPPPPPSARTVEEFDTTSATARAEAVSVGGDGRLLGSDIASLGDPARPGFWIETALVSEAGRGRVSLAGEDESVEVDLIPGTSGSRLSLAALRVLGVPLTDLPTVDVYAF